MNKQRRVGPALVQLNPCAVSPSYHPLSLSLSSLSLSLSLSLLSLSLSLSLSLLALSLSSLSLSLSFSLARSLSLSLSLTHTLLQTMRRVPAAVQRRCLRSLSQRHHHPPALLSQQINMPRHWKMVRWKQMKKIIKPTMVPRPDMPARHVSSEFSQSFPSMTIKFHNNLWKYIFRYPPSSLMQAIAV